MRQKLFYALMLVLWGAFFGARVPAKESAEPKTGPVLKSVFPLGGNPGSRFEAVVRGEDLEGAYAVWLDCSRLHDRAENDLSLFLGHDSHIWRKPFRPVLRRLLVMFSAHLVHMTQVLPPHT